MVSTRSTEYINRKLAGTHMIVQGYSGILEKDAKSNATWTDRSSHARQAIHSGVEGMGRHMTLYLAHGVKYGVFLEEGTDPHVIRPKNKKALFWTGATHPVKMVNHPGTKSHPVIEDTLVAHKGKLTKDIIAWWANER